MKDERDEFFDFKLGDDAEDIDDDFDYEEETIYESESPKKKKHWKSSKFKGKGRIAS